MYITKYTQEEKERFLEISKAGAIAVFVYSKNVFAGGEIKHYDSEKKGRAVAFGGEIYVPVTFFADFLGKDITDFSELVRESRGEKYLPVIKCARLLGLAADTFYEDRLAVIGTEEQVAVMHSSDNIGEAAAYTLFGGYDATGFTPEDYKAARARWAYMLVGSKDINDLADPVIREKVEKVGTYGENLWKNMNKSDDRIALWGDQPISESRTMGEWYVNLATLAKAWGTWGSQLYHNEALAKDILAGLEWMYQRYYGEDVINGVGWRSPKQFNWWDWFIPTPQAITEIMFIMEEYFDLDLRKKYLKCFEWITTHTYNEPIRVHSAGRVGVYTQCALATENHVMLARANADFDWLLDLVDDQEGPRVDFAQWTHGMAYNNAYGVMNLERGLRIASFLAGTPLEFSSPRIYTYFNLARYMFEPVMYNGRAMSFMAGRQTYMSETVKCGGIWWQLLRLYGMFGEDEDKYIEGMFLRHVKNAELLDRIKVNGTVHTCRLVDDLFKGDGQPSSYEYAHSYYTADRAVQHRNNYAFAISLSSNREPAFEASNFVNLNGWHLGDGATHIYTDYDPLTYNPDYFYLKNNEIAYRFPGTTEDARERIAICVVNSYHPANDFAGSLSVDGKYVVAAMDFRSLNNPVDLGLVRDSGYSLPKHLNDLRAKKSYFCLDGEIICLGADITSTMDSPVATTLEHVRIVDADKDNQYVDSKLLSKADTDGRIKVSEHVNMEGHSGFVVLDGDAYARRYTCDKNGYSYFEIGIDHGKNPTGATYAYAVIPYADNKTLESYKSAGSIEIISNTAACQAVRKASIGLSSYVFYGEGECDGVAVDAPAIVTVKENYDGTRTLQLTDPTQKSDSVAVTIPYEIKAVKAHAKLTVEVGGGKTVITADTTLARGRRFDIIYK